MSGPVHATIRATATSFLTDLWHRRHEIWQPSPTAPDEIFPLDVRAVAEHGLRVRFEEPEEIPPAVAVSPHAVPVETAGFVDRRQNRIVVAQKFQNDYRRFTGAHEIGHWLLHPNLTYHRDRPLKGHERLHPRRPQEEQEADIFAAELLMPSKYFRRCFRSRFGNPICISDLDDDTMFWLSRSNPVSDHVPNFASRGKRYVALTVAVCSFFANRHFDSIAAHFGVSPTAAAIQLEELKLVVN